jgi:hypothetical protein
MIASIRCPSWRGRWLLNNPIVHVQKGTCWRVPTAESLGVVGGSERRHARIMGPANAACRHRVLVQYVRYTSIPAEARYSAGVR